MTRRFRVGQGFRRHDVIELLEGHEGVVVQGVACVAGTGLEQDEWRRWCVCVCVCVCCLLYTSDAADES